MSLEPVNICHDAPLKLMATDLKKVMANKSEPSYPWKIKFCDDSNFFSCVVKFKQIWLQGSVLKVGKNTEDMLVRDGSGEVRVTKCSRVPGDISWITSGVYCSIMASVIEPSKTTPEIAAIKLMHIKSRRNDAELLWPLEVQELKAFLRGKITINTGNV